MRRVLVMALVGSAFAAAPMAPAEAALVLVGTFDGNQCGGGDITTCYASGTTPNSGSLTQVGARGAAVPGSPGILRDETPGGGLTFGLTNDLLTYSYSGATVAHYIGLFNGGSAVGCTPGVNCFNNTYFLFFSSDPITSGSIDLNLLFQNNGISHIDLFNSGPVPEPASWALMLVGFAGIGMALRRARRRNPGLLQIA